MGFQERKRRMFGDGDGGGWEKPAGRGTGDGGRGREDGREGGTRIAFPRMGSCAADDDDLDSAGSSVIIHPNCTGTERRPAPVVS